MADFFIRPDGASDWLNAISFSGTVPVSDVDATALGLVLGDPYEVARIGEPAPLTVPIPAVPVLSGLVATPISETEITWSVTSDTSGGTIYAAAEFPTDPALTAAEIRQVSGVALAGDTDASPQADGSNGGTISGLSPNTTYQIAALQDGPNGQASSIAFSAIVTTPNAADTTPPSAADVTVAAQAGATVPITVTALTEDAPNCYIIGTPNPQTSLTAAQVVAGMDETGAAAPIAEGPFALDVVAGSVMQPISQSVDDTFYLYLSLGDASLNYSTPLEMGPVAIDTPDAVGLSVSRLLSTPFADSSETTDTHATGAVTPTGGRPVVVVVHLISGAAPATELFAASFGAVDLLAGPAFSATAGRNGTYVYVIENPATTAQAVTITPNSGINTRGIVIEVLEIGGARTTATVGASDSTHLNSSSPDGQSLDITTGTAGSLVLYASSRQFDGNGLSHIGGLNSLSETTSGGGEAFRDPLGRISWALAANAGVQTASTNTPSTSIAHTNVILEIRAA